jgi:hypothetical protein
MARTAAGSTHGRSRTRCRRGRQKSAPAPRRAPRLRRLGQRQAARIIEHQAAFFEAQRTGIEAQPIVVVRRMAECQAAQGGGGQGRGARPGHRPAGSRWPPPAEAVSQPTAPEQQAKAGSDRSPARSASAWRGQIRPGTTRVSMAAMYKCPAHRYSLIPDLIPESWHVRTPHRPALHARPAARRCRQPLHLLHFADFHAGPGAGRGGADRGAVGDERLPEGAAQRILGVVSHIQVSGGSGELADWARPAAVARTRGCGRPRPTCRHRAC